MLRPRSQRRTKRSTPSSSNFIKLLGKLHKCDCCAALRSGGAIHGWLHNASGLFSSLRSVVSGGSVGNSSSACEGVTPPQRHRPPRPTARKGQIAPEGSTVAYARTPQRSRHGPLAPTPSLAFAGAAFRLKHARSASDAGKSNDSTRAVHPRETGHARRTLQPLHRLVSSHLPVPDHRMAARVRLTVVLAACVRARPACRVHLLFTSSCALACCIRRWTLARFWLQLVLRFQPAAWTICWGLRSPMPRQSVLHPPPPSLHLAAVHLSPGLHQRHPPHQDDHPLDPYHDPVP